MPTDERLDPVTVPTGLEDLYTLLMTSDIKTPITVHGSADVCLTLGEELDSFWQHTLADLQARARNARTSRILGLVLTEYLFIGFKGKGYLVQLSPESRRGRLHFNVKPNTA